MQIRKFFGANTREVLREVRDALGSNALILSNRQVAGGIEIMAMAEDEAQALAHVHPAPGSRTGQSQPVFKSVAPLPTPQAVAPIEEKMPEITRQELRPSPTKPARSTPRCRKS